MVRVSASVQKFDTALGTLNTVLIQYDISVGLSALFVNTSTTAGTVTVGNNVQRLNCLTRVFGSPNLLFRNLHVQNIGGDYMIAAGSLKNIELGFNYDSKFDSNRNPLVGSGFSTSLFAGTGNFDFDLPPLSTRR